MLLEPYRAATHYATIASWWQTHGTVCLPHDVLPPVGVVAHDGQELLAATFCYIFDGCKTAYVAFTIANPHLQPRPKLSAIKQVLRGVIAMARSAGCKLIWSATENDSLNRICIQLGFRPTLPQKNYFLLLDPALSFEMLVGDDFDASALATTFT